MTIQEVAQAAGVAVSTVSRVLNASDYASRVTREKVLAVAAALNYKANPSARGLRSSQTCTIGVLLSDLANPIYTEFIRGAEHAAQDRGYELLIADGQNSRDVQARMLQTLYERRIDALILRGPVLATGPLGQFVDEGVPVFPAVRRQGGRALLDEPREEMEANLEAFRHIVGLGHRRIAFFSRGLNPQMNERFGALQSVLAENGLDPSGAKLEIVQDTADCRVRVESLIAGPERPTAYVAGAHLLAPYLLAALRDAGLDIPRDVSFLCFGDSPWALAYNPPVSAIRFDYYEAGVIAVEAVLASLGQCEEPKSRRLPAEFVNRGSCGPPSA